ncbi:MAG: hypothetical protein NPINA01_04540 [Nitrospinaceae bacterium]|nr:MAG: hypothetical protein NPINA01_04540 [Nitrospinaceae bacterium]
MLGSKVMSLKNKIRLWVQGAFFSFCLFGQVLMAGASGFSDWDVLLKKYVGTTTVHGVTLNAFPYKDLKGDPGFQKVVDQLKSASVQDLTTREQKLSFWINVYNILAAKVVVDNYPVESINDVGSIFKRVWKRPAGVVDGKMRTLDEVEHEILRKMGDPRIHVAIVCASVSCPDIRKEAYTAERLDEQLDDQVRKFLENVEKGMKIDEKRKRVYLSSIFKWFEEDFESQGGVISFVSRYAPPSKKEGLQKFGKNVKYLDYDWDLNELTAR